MSRTNLVRLVVFIVAAAAVLALVFRPRPIEPLEVGDKARDFTLPTLNSGAVGLASFRHKVLVLNFWASWCPPCVEEAPSLEKFAVELRPLGVEVVSVSVDQDTAALQKFAQEHHLTFAIARDPNQTLSARYGTYKFPETYIISRDGRVAEKIIGGIDWQDPRIIEFVRELAHPTRAGAETASSGS